MTAIGSVASLESERSTVTAQLIPLQQAGTMLHRWTSQL